MGIRDEIEAEIAAREAARIDSRVAQRAAAEAADPELEKIPEAALRARLEAPKAKHVHEGYVRKEVAEQMVHDAIDDIRARLDAGGL